MLFLTTRITEWSNGYFLLETLPARANSVAIRRGFDRATDYEESHKGRSTSSRSGTQRAGHYFHAFYGQEPCSRSKKRKVTWENDINTPTGPADAVLGWVRSNIAKWSGRFSAYPLPITQDLHWFALQTVVVEVGVTAEGRRFMLLEHTI